MHVRVYGFKPEIDDSDWIIVRAEHLLDGKGLIARLELAHRTVGGGPDQDKNTSAYFRS